MTALQITVKEEGSHSSNYSNSQEKTRRLPEVHSHQAPLSQETNLTYQGTNLTSSHSLVPVSYTHLTLPTIYSV